MAYSPYSQLLALLTYTIPDSQDTESKCFLTRSQISDHKLAAHMNNLNRPIRKSDSDSDSEEQIEDSTFLRDDIELVLSQGAKKYQRFFEQNEDICLDEQCQGELEAMKNLGLPTILLRSPFEEQISDDEDKQQKNKRSKQKSVHKENANSDKIDLESPDLEDKLLDDHLELEPNTVLEAPMPGAWSPVDGEVVQGSGDEDSESGSGPEVGSDGEVEEYAGFNFVEENSPVVKANGDLKSSLEMPVEPTNISNKELPDKSDADTVKESTEVSTAPSPCPETDLPVDASTVPTNDVTCSGTGEKGGSPISELAEMNLESEWNQYWNAIFPKILPDEWSTSEHSNISLSTVHRCTGLPFLSGYSEPSEPDLELDQEMVLSTWNDFYSTLYWTYYQRYEYYAKLGYKFDPESLTQPDGVETTRTDERDGIELEIMIERKRPFLHDRSYDAQNVCKRFEFSFQALPGLEEDSVLVPSDVQSKVKKRFKSKNKPSPKFRPHSSNTVARPEIVKVDTDSIADSCKEFLDKVTLETEKPENEEEKLDKESKNELPQMEAKQIESNIPRTNDIEGQTLDVASEKCQNSRETDPVRSMVSTWKHTQDDTPENFPPALKKYWAQRYRFFSLFDEGIQMDEEGWWSVTPEKIAEHIAERCRCDVIVDAFCGVGSNSIQFAKTCERVIAIDIDPVKVNFAKDNARIYGVEDRIEFIIGDYFQIMPLLKKVDAVFLSPSWGGPQYLKASLFDLSYIPIGGYRIFELARAATPNIAYYVPRNVNVDQMVKLGGAGSNVEIEQHFLNGKLKTMTAYYGELAGDPDYVM